MSPSGDKNKDARIASPLRVIGAFIALSEVLAVAGATTVDGTARLMLVTFGVTFPFIVFGVFVWLLVNHTARLYGPGEFTSVTTVEKYAAAMKESRAVMNQSRRELQQIVTDALPESAVEDAIAERTVTLDVSEFFDDDPVWIPVTDRTTVQGLLDQAYFALSSAVDAYTYGSDWLLERDGKVLRDLESEMTFGPRPDLRPLSAVGIEAGDELRAVRVK